MEKFIIVTRHDLPLKDKEDIKKSRPDRYNQGKDKKD